MSKTSFLPGTITIARPSGGDCDFITIEVVDKTSGVEFIEIQLSYADFTLALTGRSFTPCQFNLRGVKLVGSKCEVKTEIIPFERFGKRGEPDVDLTLAPYKVDGWIPRAEDLHNGHRRREGGQEVHFHRYVNAKGEPIL